MIILYHTLNERNKKITKMKKILAIISSALLIVWLILLPILTLNGGVAPTPETEALVDEFVWDLSMSCSVSSDFRIEKKVARAYQVNKQLPDVKKANDSASVLINNYLECRDWRINEINVEVMDYMLKRYGCECIAEAFEIPAIISKLSFSQLKDFKREISDLKLECDADLVDTIDDELELRTGIYIAVSAVLVLFCAVSLFLFFKKPKEEAKEQTTEA